MNVLSAAAIPARAQSRMVLIDQDGSGPGGSNQMSMMVLLQSPQVEVLGITMVTGNAWRDAEARHTLRMLELIGRTDVPVALGAVFPLVRTEQETRLGSALVGQVEWLGAWGQKLEVPAGTAGAAGAAAGGTGGAVAGGVAGTGGAGGVAGAATDTAGKGGAAGAVAGGATGTSGTGGTPGAGGTSVTGSTPSAAGTGSPAAHSEFPGPWDVPPLEEGEPHTQPIAEDAVHFLIRQVHAHPQQITVYAAGPLTNIALALAIDPHFAELAQGLVVMGGSLNPYTDDPEFATSPRHEFNFWFDPEAARITLRAHWPRIDVTTVDVSIKAMFTQAMLDAISKSPSPAAQYIAKYSQDRYYLWDELAACAWLDPSIITKTRSLYVDVDVSHGPAYGETLTWSEALKPKVDLQLMHAQVDLDLGRFSKMFVDLMSAPPPVKRPARHAGASARFGAK